VSRVYEREREEMVNRLVAYGYLRSKEVIDAMRLVPRHMFVPEENIKYAYEDCPLPVGRSQTISAPHMVAMMCETLELKPWHKVLEIGTGTGYHACIVAAIIGEGVVYSVERFQSLAERARENLRKAGCGRVRIIVGDGSKGYPDEAPYDRIYVTAGAPAVPENLLEQLAPDGRLLIPIGSRYTQELMLVEKSKGSLLKKNLGGCAFVPLIGEHGWKE
jgi:protein-L-isoaspartate(D-aspartate) O-methyltransferase